MSRDDLHDDDLADLRDDPFDRALRHELHHSVPSPMGAPDQLDRLRPRFVRAQRRRTAITGLVAAAAIALVLVGVGSLTREPSSNLPSRSRTSLRMHNAWPRSRSSFAAVA